MPRDGRCAGDAQGRPPAYTAVDDRPHGDEAPAFVECHSTGPPRVRITPLRTGLDPITLA